MSAAPPATWLDADRAPFRRAIELGAAARAVAPPNPWVGCVIVAADGRWFEGATQLGGRPHAEVVALDAAGAKAAGSTAYVTLEPCAHHGRTPPCAVALVDAGVARVVVGVADPDPRVAGAGIELLVGAGLDVVRAPASIVAEAVDSLEPYLEHRRTGRPFVVLKLAATLDGRTAAPDGTSQWITGVEARADAHRLRAESDAVIVGAGTVAADDPSLTVRLAEAPRGPARVVLGSIPEGAKVQPALELRRSAGAPCSTTWAPRACSRCWSRAAPRWPTDSTPRAWSTATCSTSRRPCSAATTPAGSSPAPVRRASTTSGGVGSRDPRWARTARRSRHAVGPRPMADRTEPGELSGCATG